MNYNRVSCIMNTGLAFATKHTAWKLWFVVCRTLTSIPEYTGTAAHTNCEVIQSILIKILIDLISLGSRNKDMSDTYFVLS